MKKLILLFTTYLLLLSCSSDDNNDQPSAEIVDYKHRVVLVAEGTVNDGEVFVKVNHTYVQGNSIDETHIFTFSGERYIPTLDNSNPSRFTLTNNSSSIMNINFDAVRGDGNGGFLSPDERNDFFVLESNTTKTVIYDYNEKEYLEQ